MGKTYVDSPTALSICQAILNQINQNDGTEHAFFRTGEMAFDSKTFMESTSAIELTQSVFGHDWKATRYHNLVRLGGDIERSGLADYPKATILGGLLHYAKDKASE